MALTCLHSRQEAARWLSEGVTGMLRTDSRLVRSGDGFIAWPGHGVDGRDFVAAALQAGATRCLVDATGVEAFGFADARVAALPQLKAATGAIADEYYGEPSLVLDVIASTGTNGKTSTAWWTAQALSRLGRRCGLIGTLGVGEPSKLTSTGLTTPDAVSLQRALRGFVDQDFKACALEASSIGLAEHRLDATRIRVALFTNFTQDHLDYHGSMAAYWEAKQQLFEWPGLRAAVLNLDDAKGVWLAQHLPKTLDLWTYAVNGAARLSASGLHYVDGGLAFTLAENADQHLVRTPLIGDYNVSNLLAVIGGLRALGLPLADIVSVCAHITPVLGRMQRVGDGIGKPQVVIDYAHTPDALEKVLQALQPLAQARGGKLWCVFGCGGNRDAGKRPLMGAIAACLAQHVVITSDNPRHEPAAEILQQIVAGLEAATPHQVIEDRRQAIQAALAQADPRDVIVIAGKGHEDYQDIAGVKRPFSDAEEAGKALAQRGMA